MIATAAVAVQVTDRVVPEYRTSGSVLFLAPNLEGDTQPGSQNPYLLSSGSLRSTTAVVAQVVSSDPSRSAAAGAGASAAYAVELSADNTPVLIITAIGGSPESVQNTVEVVFGAVERELKALQDTAAVPTDQQITSRVLINPDVVVELEGSEKRTAAVILGLGFVASATLAVMVESLVDLRRRRRRLAADIAAFERGEAKPSNEEVGLLP